MLRELTSSDSRFKAVQFHDGLNLLIAEVTSSSSDDDSRNSVGKSSLIEIIHFVLGASATPSTSPLAKASALREHSFALRMDWPRLDGPLYVQRSLRRAGVVAVDPPLTLAPGDQLPLGHHEISVSEWQQLIERDLFGLPADHPGLSGRTMLSFLARRASANAFNAATRTFSRQPESEATNNLAYLLGLDWHLTDRYRQLREKDNARQQLQKAVADPLLGRIVGKTSELRGLIAVSEHRVAQLKQQIDEFRVVPEYEALSHEADMLHRRIKESRDNDVMAQRNLGDLEQAVTEAVEPDTSYLEPVYAELGLLLPDQVRQGYADVERFHASVMRNRRQHLDAEITALREGLQSRAAERQRMGERLAVVLSQLNAGGALDTLTTMQRILAEEQAALQALRLRFEAAEALDASQAEIKAARLALQQEVRLDLAERQQAVNDAVVLFSDYAKRLYGQDREAYLRFDPGESSLRIAPHIASDSSGGIGNMVIFCFDLALAVIAHRAGRAPDFLLHDSHVFDGVDERQVRRALALAVEVADTEGLQYIVTMNSDELDRVTAGGFTADPYVLTTRLTDAYLDGGLFGFRF